ncbi:SusC/RagA family TonB-linked outer membrane protein [Algoriphagus resistens]|uniref:SusC/RagA family TonB-linked outer membrane protein n=1 Tax=Algoriphagus resistens TaxID=1750590 RepID=UPI0009E6B56A|nr:TonB-dependent receptor [Algoriphagus resistens]
MMLKFFTYFFKWQQFASLILLLSISHMASAQQQNVSGTVTDDTNETLIGVTILINGTTRGTVTDIDGRYDIQASPSDVLVFSYIGYTSQEITVGSRTILDVVLVSDASDLGEVVVVGYTTQSKKLSTGSMSQIKTEEALAVPITNAAEALQGRAAGVTVVTGGQPGSTPIVRVRGFGSTNNNGPLYIIDGMQTTDGNVLAQINPSDIASMNVLKDASAAIYGARASNGVIIITTKSGSKGAKPIVQFNSFYGFQEASNVPELLNSEQLGEVFWQSYLNDGIAPRHAQYGDGPTPVVPEYIRGNPDLPYDPITNRLTRARTGNHWLDEIFRKGSIQNYDLSIQGGGQNTRYLMSVGYQNREGVQLHTGFERFVTRLNSEIDVNEHIRFGEHLSFSYSDQLSQNQVQGAVGASPLIPNYDEGGNFAGAGPSTAAGLNNLISPLANLERGRDNFNRNFRFVGDAFVDVNFLNDFTARSTIGINYNNTFAHAVVRKSPESPEPVTTTALNEIQSINSSWVWTNTVRYNKQVGDHTINLLAGAEAVNESLRLSNIRIENFLLEDADYLILGTGNNAPNIADSRWEQNTLSSYFFNADYAYKGKYLASVSVRQDKSSRFAKGNNSGVFPSGSVGWIISEEDFMKNKSKVSLLKLRASYGLLGNQSIPIPNPFLNIYQTNPEYSFYSIQNGTINTGTMLSRLGNPNLRWEISQQANIGLDLGFLNNDASFSIDVYNKSTRDMIIASPLPSTAIDAAAPYINAGKVTNRGVDLSLAYGNFSKESTVKWDVGLNISAYKNELVSLNDANPSAFLTGANFYNGIITRSSSGEPISYFYGRDIIGIFQNAEEVAAAPSQGFANPAAGVGRFRYRDIDGNGIINDADRTNLGNPHPDFTYGLNANLSYKKFSLTMFFQGSQGNEIYNFLKVYTDFGTFFNGNRSPRVLDAWTETNRDATLPMVGTSVKNSESAPNSYYVEDGSYLRLKNLQFGYNFSLPKLGVNNALVYLQGTNLFTITNYTGTDPETGSTGGSDLTFGVDTGTYPIAKAYTVGLNFSF